MANFLEAHKVVMGNEGALADDKDDHGGLTYKGVAEKKHPGWPGWPIVKGIIANSPVNVNAALQNNQSLQAMVLSFYKTEFWNVIKGDRIVSQNIAEAIYDDAVNSGPETAVKKVQNVAFSLPNQTLARKAKIKDLDILYGFMDVKTLNKINNVV
jgi:lysozyme family protein